MLEMASEGAGRFKASFAGDTFNTVWYVAQLAGGEVQPMYLTAVGDDRPSDEMVEFMKASGVEPLVKRRSGMSVGLYMISLKNGERSFSYWRSVSAARTLASDLGPLPVGRGDIVFFSGITLAILPPDDRALFLNAVRESRSDGAVVAFDPNLRPRLWSSADDMRDWTMKGAAAADICLPSYEDEAAHFGDPDPAGTCRRYASNGASVVVVKNGPEAISLLDAAACREVPVSGLASVVDTTAAGDSFNAGFILSYLRGDGLEDAAAEASRLSARVISEFGALVNVNLPTKA